jgi:hypothetical protein
MQNPKFKLQKSSDGQYYFNLLAGNGEVLLTSERYTQRSSALGGIAAVKDNAANDARYDRRTSSSGQAYFVLRAGNNEVLGTSEMYSSATALENGIAAVKRAAAEAGVEG